MESQIKQWIKDIKNPNTGISLLKENRIVEIISNNENISIKYNRDGISPIVKREIEKSIQELLHLMIKVM